MRLTFNGPIPKVTHSGLIIFFHFYKQRTRYEDRGVGRHRYGILKNSSLLRQGEAWKQLFGFV